ncbi:DUF2157 domain-containing protein [Neobacillus kokaensis]|uniref:DUF2157 domain-containing protein n=1 Tax=Neobacillus kokaensis TaxID=2759023 RepID=A0ABQ3N4I2_9BACI|nr:DUF2157 domain-containing protein [Neobacillus kokaensis]GHH99617.1 hypothetical protein AM1BK_31600 [Neobacillus kokaensis]
MRTVREKELEFLRKELKYLAETDVITAEKAEEIQSLYEVRDKLSFTRTLLYVGSILIGAGILSFIASNWDEIARPLKFLLIVGIFIACNFAGYKLERYYPKTSQSFYYLGVIIFGAGIFLVEQMFHIGGSTQDAFLWWAIGIMPLAWVLRDKWILLAAVFFSLFHILDAPYIQGKVIPIWTLLLITAIYFLNRKICFSRGTAFMNGVLQLSFLATVLNFFIIRYGSIDEPYIHGLIYLVIGIALVLNKGKMNDIYVYLGYITHGGAALLLSFKDTWPLHVEWLYIPFSLLYLLFLLYLIKRGSLFSIIILCVMIFRFYLDLSFEFLPKSFVFIIGGVLLLGFGFYFEKQRRKGEGKHA